MIIFGTRVVKSKKSNGEFYCPQCAARRGFRAFRARRFFHIYFIPLIPTAQPVEVVECAGCRSGFHKDILKADPEAHLREAAEAFERAIDYVIVTMIAADGKIEEAELVRAHEIASQATQLNLSIDQIREQADAALDGRIPVDAALRSLAPRINEHGKELLVRIAADIAIADGDFDQTELELIERLAVDLGMSAAHVRGILLVSEDSDAADAEAYD